MLDAKSISEADCIKNLTRMVDKSKASVMAHRKSAGQQDLSETDDDAMDADATIKITCQWQEGGQLETSIDVKLLLNGSNTGSVLNKVILLSCSNPLKFSDLRAHLEKELQARGTQLAPGSSLNLTALQGDQLDMPRELDDQDQLQVLLMDPTAFPAAFWQRESIEIDMQLHVEVQAPSGGPSLTAPLPDLAAVPADVNIPSPDDSTQPSGIEANQEAVAYELMRRIFLVLSLDAKVETAAQREACSSEPGWFRTMAELLRKEFPHGLKSSRAPEGISGLQRACDERHGDALCHDVDECHWGITRQGAHDAFVNDFRPDLTQSDAAGKGERVPADDSGQQLDRQNLVTLLVSATPYALLTRKSRIPEQYLVKKASKIPQSDQTQLQLRDRDIIKYIEQRGGGAWTLMRDGQTERQLSAKEIQRVQELYISKLLEGSDAPFSELHIVDWVNCDMLPTCYRRIEDYITSAEKPKLNDHGIITDAVLWSKLERIKFIKSGDDSKLKKSASKGTKKRGKKQLEHSSSNAQDVDMGEGNLDPKLPDQAAYVLLLDYILSLQYYRFFRMASSGVADTGPRLEQDFHKCLVLIKDVDNVRLYEKDLHKFLHGSEDDDFRTLRDLHEHESLSVDDGAWALHLSKHPDLDLPRATGEVADRVYYDMQRFFLVKLAAERDRHTQQSSENRTHFTETDRIVASLISMEVEPQPRAQGEPSSGSWRDPATPVTGNMIVVRVSNVSDGTKIAGALRKYLDHTAIDTQAGRAWLGTQPNATTGMEWRLFDVIDDVGAREPLASKVSRWFTARRMSYTHPARRDPAFQKFADSLTERYMDSASTEFHPDAETLEGCTHRRVVLTRHLHKLPYVLVKKPTGDSLETARANTLHRLQGSPRHQGFAIEATKNYSTFGKLERFMKKGTGGGTPATLKGTQLHNCRRHFVPVGKTGAFLGLLKLLQGILHPHDADDVLVVEPEQRVKQRDLDQLWLGAPSHGGENQRLRWEHAFFKDVMFSRRHSDGQQSRRAFSDHTRVNAGTYAYKIVLQRLVLLARSVRMDEAGWLTKYRSLMLSPEGEYIQAQAGKDLLRALEADYRDQQASLLPIYLDQESATMTILNTDRLVKVINWDGRLSDEMDKMLKQNATAEHGQSWKLHSGNISVQRPEATEGDRDAAKTLVGWTGNVSGIQIVPPSFTPPSFMATADTWQLLHNKQQITVTGSEFKYNEPPHGTAGALRHWIFTPTYNRYNQHGHKQIFLDWSDAASPDIFSVRVLVVRSEQSDPKQMEGYKELVNSYERFIGGESSRHPVLIMALPTSVTLPDGTRLTERLGCGYARLCIQLIAYYMGMTCVWMLDDNVRECFKLDLGTLLAQPERGHTKVPVPCRFDETMQEMEKQAMSVPSVPGSVDPSFVESCRWAGTSERAGCKEDGPRGKVDVSKHVPVTCPSDYSGPGDKYAVIGVSRQLRWYSKVGAERGWEPWKATHAVASMFLLNVKSTVEARIFYPAKIYREDYEFHHMCEVAGLAVVKCSSVFHRKVHMQQRRGTAATRVADTQPAFSVDVDYLDGNIISAGQLFVLTVSQTAALGGQQLDLDSVEITAVSIAGVQIAGPDSIYRLGPIQDATPATVLTKRFLVVAMPDDDSASVSPLDPQSGPLEVQLNVGASRLLTAVEYELRRLCAWDISRYRGWRPPLGYMPELLRNLDNHQSKDVVTRPAGLAGARQQSIPQPQEASVAALAAGAVPVQQQGARPETKEERVERQKLWTSAARALLGEHKISGLTPTDIIRKAMLVDSRAPGASWLPADTMGTDRKVNAAATTRMDRRPPGAPTKWCLASDLEELQRIHKKSMAPPG
ncbi:hypothetical protein WJX72_009343 [[Myrmecia] bisecta]|uniref:GREB1-like circularly permuted SF2 helicase domain-containing protein n=1 Tax=[Myrmecia] bisecta TaxID=41462 RepID=A0AAW1QFX9_9CHLO